MAPASETINNTHSTVHQQTTRHTEIRLVGKMIQYILPSAGHNNQRFQHTFLCERNPRYGERSESYRRLQYYQYRQDIDYSISREGWDDWKTMSVEWDDGEKSALSPYTEGNKLLNISWLSKPLQLMVFFGLWIFEMWRFGWKLIIVFITK